MIVSLLASLPDTLVRTIIVMDVIAGSVARQVAVPDSGLPPDSRL